MRILFWVFFLLLLQACASGPSVTPEDISTKAAPIFGQSFKLYYVPSRGAVMDTQFIVLSKKSPDSGMATQLATVISKAAEVPVNIAVGGPNSAKSAIVIQNAIELNQGKSLSQLHLVFVGNVQDSEGPNHSVSSSGAKFTFVQNGL